MCLESKINDGLPTLNDTYREIKREKCKCHR